MMKLNDVVLVEAGIGLPRKAVRVVRSRDCQQKPILPASIARRPEVRRSRNLVTAQEKGGRVVSFYAERTAHQKCGLLRKAGLFLTGKLPQKV